jgi:hypothetical protein
MSPVSASARMYLAPASAGRGSLHVGAGGMAGDVLTLATTITTTTITTRSGWVSVRE